MTTYQRRKKEYQKQDKQQLGLAMPAAATAIPGKAKKPSQAGLQEETSTPNSACHPLLQPSPMARHEPKTWAI
jgi:hypothetical protein